MAALGHLSAAVTYGAAPGRLQRRTSARRAASRTSVVRVAAATDYDTVVVGAGVSGKAESYHIACCPEIRGDVWGGICAARGDLPPAAAAAAATTSASTSPRALRGSPHPGVGLVHHGRVPK